jgi:hypothetical protein
LHHHQLLAFPAKSTLYHNIDTGAEGGISEDCPDYLKQKVSTLAKWHGILMFD